MLFIYCIKNQWQKSGKKNPIYLPILFFDNLLVPASQFSSFNVTQVAETVTKRYFCKFLPFEFRWKPLWRCFRPLTPLDSWFSESSVLSKLSKSHWLNLISENLFCTFYLIWNGGFGGGYLLDLVYIIVSKEDFNHFQLSNFQAKIILT